MKKRILTVVLSFVMLLSMGTVAFASEQQIQKRTEETVINDILNISYNEISVSDDISENELCETISQEDNAKIEDKVQELLCLSDDEYNNYLKTEVEALLKQTIDNPNVSYDETFFNNYVKVYAPSYENKAANKLARNMTYEIQVPSSRMAAGSKDSIFKNEQRITIPNVAVLTLKVRVKWAWNASGIVTTCIPKTWGETNVPLAEWVKVVDGFEREENGGANYHIYKRGDFRYSFQDVTLKHAYVDLGIRVYAGGGATLYSTK